MRVDMERVMGIEPTLPAWKAGALPLSYTRMEKDAAPCVKTHLPTLARSVCAHKQPVSRHA